MYHNPRRLRRPEERVGHLANADLPPPAGDEAAFQQLHDRHHASMMRLAMTFVRTKEEAEEVLQDTWLAVLSGIDRFEGRSSFKTWLFTILINRARSRAKREARVTPFSDSEAVDDVVADSSSPEQSVLDRELAGLLERAVASLPRTQRLVISLRDIEGWSAEEVCETLAITHANQRVLLHRARMKVREQLSPYLRKNELRD